jgi:nifR3 family TIM-barrel protein
MAKIAKIGTFEPANRLFLAPLAGITDKSFRRLCAEQGAALVCSEMVSAKALCYRNKNSEELLRTDAREGPVAFQLFGSDPEIMAEAAALLDDRMNVLLDVNMGCPVPKVVKNGEGSALLRNPMQAGRIVEAMKARTKKPVTVKIRAGWDRDSVNAVEIARTLESAGADAICLHGRTREQYYSGKADWNLIGRVKASVKIPVIGNGDVCCQKDAARMLRETGCDYVMVARGALGNPWIFSGGQPSRNERATMFLRHALLAAEHKGERMAVLEMRKHAGWYFKGVPGAAAFRHAVNQTTRLDDLIAEVKGLDGSHGSRNSPASQQGEPPVSQSISR